MLDKTVAFQCFISGFSIDEEDRGSGGRVCSTALARAAEYNNSGAGLAVSPDFEAKLDRKPGKAGEGIRSEMLCVHGVVGGSEIAKNFVPVFLQDSQTFCIRESMRSRISRCMGVSQWDWEREKR